MIVAIHQPNYLPYLGYFYKIAKCDTFVFLDDAQYSNDAMHNWNRIKTPQGDFNLKVPVQQHFGDKICDVICRDELGWKNKHLRTIEMNYKKASHFHEVYEELSILISRSTGNLATLNESIIVWMMKKFGISADIIKSSELNISSVREERIIDIVKALGGTVYFSGSGAKVYQDPAHFEKNGIELRYTDYRPIEYKQLWGGEFIPNLSALDYVMNCGFDNSIFQR